MNTSTTTMSQIEQRRIKEQALLERRTRATLHGQENVMLLVASVNLAWFIPTVNQAVHPPLTLAMAMASFASLVVIAILMSEYVKARPALKDSVYVESIRGNDPSDALASLDRLIDALKSPHRDARTMTKLYDQTVQRLQALRPRRPLSQLVRHGYYPSRPQETVATNVYRTVDHDVDDGTKHWERMVHAADALRAILGSEEVFTEGDVDKALSDLVPPLRAVLRTHGVQTWRIDYLPQPLPAGPAGVMMGPSTVEQEAIALEGPEPEADVLTPVEQRFNASASMHAAALRTLATAFQGADETLFLGDDRTTGDVMLSQQLPRLVKAFVVADDAEIGEGRDAVRADFARSLAVMRDSLEGIMARHVKAARSVLDDQTLFITRQHGEKGL